MKVSWNPQICHGIVLRNNGCNCIECVSIFQFDPGLLPFETWVFLVNILAPMMIMLEKINSTMEAVFEDGEGGQFDIMDIDTRILGCL